MLRRTLVILVIGLIMAQCGKKSVETLPELSVTPETLNFGETKNSDHFVIENIGGGKLDWQVSPPQEPWLFVQEPLSGTNQPQTVLVNVDRSKATAAASEVLTATIYITSTKGGSKIVTVRVVIPFRVIINQGPQEEATIHTSEITFGWEANIVPDGYKYRVEGSSYYGDFTGTEEGSVILKDLDESPPDVPDVFYTFTVIAIKDDKSASDQRRFRMDCIRGDPAVWIKPRKIKIEYNTEFRLSLMAEEVSDLLLAHLIIRFDQTKLKVQPGGIEKGDFLTKNSDESHLVFFPGDDDIEEAVAKANREGLLPIDMAVLQKDRPPAVSGSGVLATIRFNARVNGQTTSVTFDGETKLRDSENTTMALSGRYGSTVEIK